MQSIADIKRTVTPILKEYGVTRAEVFGSAARGDMRPDSDVDLVVSLGEPMGLLKFIELRNRLEDALGRKVDIMTPSSINKHLAPHIIPNLVPLYEG